MSKHNDGKGVSRRDLLTFWRRPLAEAVRPSAAAQPTPEPSLPAPLRPPGMMHEDLLRALCTRCGKCVEACPADAIVPLGPEWGRAARTPAIFARQQPCVLCDGLRCTHVCPSGALTPVYVNNDVVMGTAAIDEATCVTYAGQACDRCQQSCPMPGALSLSADGKMRVDASHCVGCGVCEHVCPTQPTSIRVVPRA